LKSLVKLHKKKIAIFMDNLKVHKKEDVLPWYKKLNIKVIWNATYSPQLNPIEASFS
jgi:hypothetical protein